MAGGARSQPAALPAAFLRRRQVLRRFSAVKRRNWQSEPGRRAGAPFLAEKPCCPLPTDEKLLRELTRGIFLPNPPKERSRCRRTPLFYVVRDQSARFCYFRPGSADVFLKPSIKIQRRLYPVLVRHPSALRHPPSPRVLAAHRRKTMDIRKQPCPAIPPSTGGLQPHSAPICRPLSASCGRPPYVLCS